MEFVCLCLTVMFGFIVYNKSSRPVHLKKSKEQQDLYQNEKQKL